MVKKCVAVCCSVLRVDKAEVQRTVAVAGELVRCSVLQRVAVWCSVVQCGAVCCSVLQCVAHVTCCHHTLCTAISCSSGDMYGCCSVL